MGTRLNYEIYTGDTPNVKPAVVLFSNSHSIDAEKIFRDIMSDDIQKTSLKEKISLLFDLRVKDNERVSCKGEVGFDAVPSLFWLDSSQGDREAVIQAYKMDNGEMKVIKKNAYDATLEQPMTIQEACYSADSNGTIKADLSIPLSLIMNGDFESFLDVIEERMIESGSLGEIDYNMSEIDPAGDIIFSVSGVYDSMDEDIDFDVEVALFTPDDFTTPCETEVFHVSAPGEEEAKELAEQKFIDNVITLEPGDIVSSINIEVSEPSNDAEGENMDMGI